MNAITPPPRNETEALLFEKLQSFLADIDTADDNAQYGHVLDDMDDFLFTAIRQLAAETLEKKIQERINAAEQTDEVKQCHHCKKNEIPQDVSRGERRYGIHYRWIVC